MKKRGGNRLKYQVEKALKSINYIGQSKKEFRDAEKDTGIHSIKQMEHALSVSQNFAEWLKTEKGKKDLFQLKRSDYRDYMEYMKFTGVSNGHLINVETNLRLLNKGMEKISEQKGMQSRDWVPKQRIVDVMEREKPKDRSYSTEEIERIREKMSTNVQVGADLQLAFGLRLREVANTKVAHILERDGKLFWRAVSDREALNTAVGVTKAGRARETPCRPEYEQRIRELISGKQSHEFVSNAKYNSLKAAYYRAGTSGSHGFRHTYAREMLTQKLKNQGIYEQGRSMIQRMLENRAAGYRKDHLVTRDERELYKQVIAAVDQVHADLGHGRGRIDLCEVYMAGI